MCKIDVHYEKISNSAVFIKCGVFAPMRDALEAQVNFALRAVHAAVCTNLLRITARPVVASLTKAECARRA